MIELLTGGGFIVDSTILSKKQIEVLETLKRSDLLNNLSIASVEDISAMKVISIIQRGLKKDFIDLWAIIRQTEYSPVSYTHLRAHETRHDLVCRLLLEKKKTKQTFGIYRN